MLKLQHLCSLIVQCYSRCHLRLFAQYIEHYSYILNFYYFIPTVSTTSMQVMSDKYPLHHKVQHPFKRPRSLRTPSKPHPYQPRINVRSTCHTLRLNGSSIWRSMCNAMCVSFAIVLRVHCSVLHWYCLGKSGVLSADWLNALMYPAHPHYHSP